MSILTFFSEVKAEFLKVTWPTMDEFIGHMIVVAVTVGFVTVIVGAMDYGFASLLTWFFS